MIFNHPYSLLFDKAESRLSSDEIIVLKKAKQGRKKVDKEVNIKEHIKSFELNKEYEWKTYEEICEDCVRFSFNFRSCCLWWCWWQLRCLHHSRVHLHSWMQVPLCELNDRTLVPPFKE